MELEVQNINVVDVARSSIIPFFHEQPYQFSEFVDCCTSNYSYSERVILDSNATIVLCRVNLQSIRESLGLFKAFPQNYESFNESDITRIYRECDSEVKSQFLSNILKPG